MPTTRVMEGLADMTGQQCNTLDIVRLVARRPEPTYEVRCTRCQSTSTAPHSRLRSGAARCLASGCGKVQQRQRGRDLEEEQRKQAEEREKQRIADVQAASLRRMEAEVEGYVLPTKRRPAAEHVVLTERDRIAIRQRREELEAEARTERETREKPVRELTQKINETSRQIAALERKVLLDPNVKDLDFWHDPELVGLHLTVEGATEWNYAMLKGFADSHPEFVVNDHNLQILNNYFSKHSVLMFTTEQLNRVYKRMLACGIPFDAPEQANTDVIANDTPSDTKRPDANLTIAPAKEPDKPKAPTYEGFDLQTGEPRTFTEREVARMSSEEFKKAMQMVARGEMGLPRIGPGPNGRGYRA